MPSALSGLPISCATLAASSRTACIRSDSMNVASSSRWRVTSRRMATTHGPAPSGPSSIGTAYIWRMRRCGLATSISLAESFAHSRSSRRARRSQSTSGM